MPTAITSLSALLTYLIEAAVLLTLGFILANILVETGIFDRLNRLTWPLYRISGLSPASTISILAIFINPTAGRAMYAGLYENKRVEKEEIIPTFVMSNFPIVLGESLFRVQLPAAVVLLGPVIGTLHVLLNLFSSSLQTLAAILLLKAGPPKKGPFAILRDDTKLPDCSLPLPPLYTVRFQESLSPAHPDYSCHHYSRSRIHHPHYLRVYGSDRGPL